MKSLRPPLLPWNTLRPRYKAQPTGMWAQTEAAVGQASAGGLAMFVIQL